MSVKVEYLPDGSPECPLIRLYEFNRSQAQQLRQIVQSLVTGDRQHVALGTEMWVESVAGCTLDLLTGMRNDGVRQKQPFRFECVLTQEEWGNVEELLEPFSESDISGFQWLTTYGSTPLLISATANGEVIEMVWRTKIMYTTCTRAQLIY